MKKKTEKETNESEDLEIGIQKLKEEFQRLEDERDMLLKKVQEQQEQINEMISGKYWEPTKNERGAGRKPKPRDGVKGKILECIDGGMTYKQTAEKVGLSVGLVHKIYHS